MRLVHPAGPRCAFGRHRPAPALRVRAAVRPELSEGHWGQAEGSPAGVPLLTCAAGLAALALAMPGSAHAARVKVGEFQASGFLFKDSVEVTALDDGEIPGVTIYISDFKRSLVDKLQKDFFTEPSQSSLTCSAAAGVVLPDPSKLGGTEGKEVFAEKKGLSIFKDKTLRVRRIWDADRKTLIYVAFSTRLSTAADDGKVSTGRYRTSICAVHIADKPAPALTSAGAAPAELVGAQ